MNIVQMFCKLIKDKKIPEESAPAFTYLILKNPDEMDFDKNFILPCIKRSFLNKILCYQIQKKSVNIVLLYL